MIAKTSPASAIKTDNKNILVIEDEGEMCLLLNLILVDRGLSVAHVKTLSDAEHFLLKEEPSLVLLDNRLPDGFGFDFIGYLKANYPRIKIIMITGIDKAAGDSAVAAGADVFLAKPFTRAELLQSVDSLL